MFKFGVLNLCEWMVLEMCGVISLVINLVDVWGVDWSGKDLGEFDLRDVKFCCCDLCGINFS